MTARRPLRTAACLVAATVSFAACADGGDPTAPDAGRQPNALITSVYTGPAPAPLPGVKPVCKPDLVVTDILNYNFGPSLAILPIDLNSGSKRVRFGVTVKNQGLCSAGTFKMGAYGRVGDVGDIGLGFYSESPLITDYYGTTLTPLAVGESRYMVLNVNISNWFLGYDRLRISFVADDCGTVSGPSFTTCAVAELNETNNQTFDAPIPLLPPTGF